MVLCGISSRFQLLSPSYGQVAHALLTRPPLSSLNASRRINSKSSVRLECVMHAASVHPEPGSNSRKIYIISTLRWLQSFFELFILASFTLLSIYNSYRRDLVFRTCNALYLSLVVQFSMTIAPPLGGTARILYHTYLNLSIVF